MTDLYTMIAMCSACSLSKNAMYTTTTNG